MDIWKESRVIVNLKYSDFYKCPDSGFRDQITKAGIPLMNNISEGFYRGSDAEFRQFLNILEGSPGEVKSMYYIAEDQQYIGYEISYERKGKIQNLINRISKLMKYLKGI